ncbi:hypothetical protein Bca52824_029337 [Brassica carinata]|uniref:Legume lectin domain-containing protein n=1 Tax=Brassica carinata TaxID=52824 RepID=A0A8X7VEC4_BRACI|nr:hypothetical protein Bca52824_029337 [Brassica carinata]
MSSKIISQVVLLILVLFSCSEYTHGKLVMQGSARFIKRFRTLTSTKKHAYGQAYHDEILQFKDSNGTMTSFSATFFFAIVPETKHRGSHGMAFVISPTRGMTNASADQYLGIFNKDNNGNTSNHYKDDEFGDINDNHVGININGMRSIVSAPAGYYDQDGQFRNLSLISGNLLRVTIVYSHKDTQINVTLSSPEEGYYPNKPLLSLNQDLSPYFLDKMYAGFSASTGSVGAMHYMWIWFIDGCITVPKLDLGIPKIPPYPKAQSQVGSLYGGTGWDQQLPLASPVPSHYRLTPTRLSPSPLSQSSNQHHFRLDINFDTFTLKLSRSFPSSYSRGRYV